MANDTASIPAEAEKPAKMARLGKAPALNADRRRAVRITNPAPRAPGRPTRRLADISPFGCCLELAGAEHYQPGQFVRLSFEEELTIRAIVRWVAQTRMGLEFTRPITSAEMDLALSPGVSIGFNGL